MRESATVVLAGKTLAIDKENLDEYFTFDEAQEVAKKSGKRLMTKKELEDLCECENWWDECRKGQVFRIQAPNGGFEEIFLPAAGYRYASGSLGHIGMYGLYWSSLFNGIDGHILHFSSTGVYPNSSISYQSGCSVRLVKDL